MGCTNSSALDHRPEHPSSGPSNRGVEEWVELVEERCVYHQRAVPQRAVRGVCHKTDSKAIFSSPNVVGKVSRLSIIFMAEFIGLGSQIDTAELVLQHSAPNGSITTTPVCSFQTASMLVTIERFQADLQDIDRGSSFAVVLKTTSSGSGTYTFHLSNFTLEIVGTQPPPVLVLPFEEYIRGNVFTVHSGRTWQWKLTPTITSSVWFETPPLIQSVSKVAISFSFNVKSSSPVNFHFTMAKFTLVLLRNGQEMASAHFLNVNRKNYGLHENLPLDFIMDHTNLDKGVQKLLSLVSARDVLAVRRTFIGGDMTSFLLKHFCLELYSKDPTVPCAKPIHIGPRILLPGYPGKKAKKVDHEDLAVVMEGDGDMESVSVHSASGFDNFDEGADGYDNNEDVWGDVTPDGAAAWAEPAVGGEGKALAPITSSPVTHDRAGGRVDEASTA